MRERGREGRREGEREGEGERNHYSGNYSGIMLNGQQASAVFMKVWTVHPTLLS